MTVLSAACTGSAAPGKEPETRWERTGYYIKEKYMRLDKFLKVSRLIKRRTVANEACDAGRVLVNGKTAKASLNVKNGDVLEIQFGNKTVKAEILDVKDTAKKDEAKELFRYL